MNVLIVPDKFKGTLSAREAAAAIARGWRAVRTDDTLELLPMSDGGDGFGEVMSTLLRARPRHVRTVNAAHRRCRAAWWWVSESKTAVIESANVIGLAMLPPGRFHPFELDTFGLGAVLNAAQKAGARQMFIGIGGSATNDGGFGLARALGWRFLDNHERAIENWTALHTLARIRPPGRRRTGRIIVAVDVQNRLLGVQGCTRVYGPQKGLRPRDFAPAERCLRRLVAVVQRQSGRDFARISGAGAAGGLGFGLAAFLGARLAPGFDLFARHARLGKRMSRADLVITGEGAIDCSTGMGKGVGRVAQECRVRGIPCIGLAGRAVRSKGVRQLFAVAHGLMELTSGTEAKTKPALWLARLATQAARAFRPERR